MSRICFIIGHGKSQSGGYDPGACAGGYEEYRIAKEIAEHAQAYYNKNYAEHADLLNQYAGLYLTERIERVNAAKYDFAAEIHLNAGGGMGSECYYHRGDDMGKAYAEAITAAISEAFGVRNRGAKIRLNEAGKDYFAIIRETACTAVLVETLFIDTGDMEHLKTPQGRQKCGEAIARAVAQVRGQKPAGTLYRVQVGAFSRKSNAEAMLEKLRAAGFEDAFIKEGEV